MRVLDWIAEMILRVLTSFDRAACSTCSVPYVRWIAVDTRESLTLTGCPHVEVIAHGCDRCPPLPSDRHVVDFGRERVVTCAELDAKAEAYWARRSHRAHYVRPVVRRAPRRLHAQASARRGAR